MTKHFTFFLCFIPSFRLLASIYNKVSRAF